jgi:hypothetical protein
LNSDIESVTIDGCGLTLIDTDSALRKVECLCINNNPGLKTIDTLIWASEALVPMIDLRGNGIESVERPLPWLDVLHIGGNSPSLTIRDLKFMFPKENVYYPAQGDYVATLCGEKPGLIMHTSDERLRKLYLAVYEHEEIDIRLDRFFDAKEQTFKDVV